jgi:hypothetical protein
MGSRPLPTLNSTRAGASLYPTRKREKKLPFARLWEEELTAGSKKQLSFELKVGLPQKIHSRMRLE